MFKKRKKHARRSQSSAKQCKRDPRLISRPNAALEVEQVQLSSDARRRLQVPVAAFASMAVCPSGSAAEDSMK